MPLMPKTTLEQWSVLAAIVDHGGFAQAAAVLHKSQSAVSYAVARLGEALDLPLLEIDGRRARLTAHGRTLLQRARPLLADVDTLERLAGSLKRGWEPELRLVVDAAFPRDRLLAIVADLRGRCPDTQLQLADAVLSGAEDAILDGSADLVVTSQVPPGHLGEFLFDVPFIAVASPEHPLCRLGRRPTRNDLAHHVQSVVRDSGTRHPRDAGWLGAERRYTVSSFESSVALISAGLAFAWLPDHLVAERLANGTLVVLPLEAGGTRRVPLSLVTVQPDLAGPALLSAVECFRQHVPNSAPSRARKTVAADSADRRPPASRRSGGPGRDARRR